MIGANGAGKTTLLHTISGLNQLPSGDILYEGALIAQVSTDRRVAMGLCRRRRGAGYSRVCRWKKI